MQIAWHPKKWWNICMSEDEKGEKEPNTYWGVLKVCVGSIRMEVLKYFGT